MRKFLIFLRKSPKAKFWPIQVCYKKENIYLNQDYIQVRTLLKLNLFTYNFQDFLWHHFHNRQPHPNRRRCRGKRDNYKCVEVGQLESAFLE